MTNNHGECSSDITLENLKCSVQIWGNDLGTCFGVVNLAFSNFL